MCNDFLLWKGIFVLKTFNFALQMGWVPYCYPEKTLQWTVYVVYLQTRKRMLRPGTWRSRGRWARTAVSTAQVLAAEPPEDACLGCVHSLAAPRAFTQLPKLGSFGLGILRLRSCLAPFRMRENHLRRIYKVSQFIQGIPSWITW